MKNYQAKKMAYYKRHPGGLLRSIADPCDSKELDKRQNGIKGYTFEVIDMDNTHYPTKNPYLPMRTYCRTKRKYIAYACAHYY